MSVLEKTTRVLNELARADVFLTASEVSARTDLPRSSVYRLLDELCTFGLARKDGTRYGMGPRLLLWGEAAAASFDLRQAAEASMRRLRDTLHESVHLYVRSGSVRICIAAVEGDYGLRRFVRVGDPLPLHVGAAGKVLLAFSDDPTVEESLRLARAEADTPTYPNPLEPQALMRELERIRVDPWTLSVDEREAGVAAVAAPVRDRRTVLAALCVSGPSSRLTAEVLETWRPLVEEAALQIATAYRGEPRHDIVS